MSFVAALTDINQGAPRHWHASGPTHRQRQRAQAVLLSAKGDTREQIADVLEAGGREDTGWRQVFYDDESSFCLSTPVPDLWQKKVQTVGLPTLVHSRRLNVLGFLRREGRLYSCLI